MGTSKVHSGSIAESVANLMVAIGKDVLPEKEELSADGWITAKEYSYYSKIAICTAKRRLDSSPLVSKKKAKDDRIIVTMYKVKKGNKND